jgi:hypothetical protein
MELSSSDFAFGGILSQAEEGDDSKVHPIYYGSKALNDAEKRTSVYEREFLAIVYFIHYIKMYLLGQHFVVYSDQRSLQYLIKFNEEASPKIVRWQLSLLAFDFDIMYRASKVNVNADALSRIQTEVSSMPDVEDILQDYHLPLNVIGVKRKAEGDAESTKRVLIENVVYKVIKDNIYKNKMDQT